MNLQKGRSARHKLEALGPLKALLTILDDHVCTAYTFRHVVHMLLQCLRVRSAARCHFAECIKVHAPSVSMLKVRVLQGATGEVLQDVGGCVGKNTKATRTLPFGGSPPPHNNIWQRYSPGDHSCTHQSTKQIQPEIPEQRSSQLVSAAQ